MGKRVFLDANVWFSAARSSRGSSFLIMELAKHGLIRIYANKHVLDEAERNLILKSPESVPSFYAFVHETPFSIMLPGEFLALMRKGSQ